MLNRSGTLTERELELHEKYPREAVAILRRLGYLDLMLLDVLLHHREIWNGTDYPDKLSGEDSPVGVRITSVAEA